EYPEYLSQAMQILQNVYNDFISPTMKNFINSVTQEKSKFNLIDEFLKNKNHEITKDQLCNYIQQFNDIIKTNHEKSLGQIIKKWIEFYTFDKLLENDLMTKHQKGKISKQRDKMIKHNNIFRRIIL